MELNILLDGSEQIPYPDPAVPIYAGVGLLSPATGMSRLSHWHEDVELVMPVRGELFYNVNGLRVPVGPGECIFVNARQLHAGFCEGGECEYLCLTFRPQLLCESDRIRDSFVLPLVTAVQLPCLVLRRSDPAQGQIMEQVEALVSLILAQPPAWELTALSRLFGLWRELYSQVSGQLDAPVSADGNVLILRQMLDAVRTRYRETMSLNDIAASGGVSRSRCCQIFRDYLGYSPNDYLNSFRLEKGMELLRSTDLPVARIAEACGFHGGSYFTELFSRKKGITPTQYRHFREETP